MSTQLINQVLELTNVERANAGLEPLTFNEKLANAADDHSDSMAEDDFFSHTGVDGSSVSDRVQSNGYQYSTVGENIAAGYATAEAVVQGWMDSPGHRANILNPDFTEIGIGYEFLENDTGAVNYNHYWTQVFGTSLYSNSQDATSQEAGDLETDNSLSSEEVETTNSASEGDTTTDNSSQDLMDEELESTEEKDLPPETTSETDELSPKDTITDDSNAVMEEDSNTDNWEVDYDLLDNSSDEVTGNSQDTIMTGGEDSFDFTTKDSSTDYTQNDEVNYQHLQELFTNFGWGSWLEYAEEYQEIVLEGNDNSSFEFQYNFVEY